MQTTAIVTDTNSGLNAAQAADLGVWLLPMPYSIDGTLYQEDRPGPDLFEALAAGSAVSTSQPAPGDVTALWDRLLEDHEHVIHLPMSSGLSGSWETARTLAGDYSGRVLVPDLRRISVTLLQSVRVARRLAEEGVPAEEIAARLEARRQEASIYIALDTLEPLKRGGRVSAATALLGTALNVKPVLHVDNEGHLIKMTQVHGRKKSIKKLAEKLAETILPDSPIFISNADCLDDAEYLKDILKNEYGKEVTLITSIGSVIGAHAGPGTLALFFLGKER